MVNVVTLLTFIAGFPLLLFGAEWVVKGASRLAVAWGISPLVVGLTIVAYGTSAPELAVTIMATWAPDKSAETTSDPKFPQEVEQASQAQGASDIAVGNVVGSNIANFLLVLGASALVAPLLVRRVVIRRSMPLVIFVSVLVLLMAWDWNGDGQAKIEWWQGGLLVLGAIIYTGLAMRKNSAENQQNEAEAAEEIDEEFGHIESTTKAWLIELARIAAGLFMLVLGAHWLVQGAVAAATWLGVSKLIIALTIVAIGTSLPEVATCVMAVLRGHRDLAVGNAVGSNLFNILLVLGMCSLVAPGGGVVVSEQAIYYDIPIMIGVAVLVVPIAFTGFIISRGEGAIFLAFYTAYTIYLILRELNSPLLGTFVNGILFVVLPLLIVYILWQIARNMRSPA